MGDPGRVYAIIMGIQLVTPIVVGVPVMIWGDITDKRVAAKGRTTKAAARSKGRALAPLVCPSCSAPVPLASAPFPCPSCAATVTPPDEYVRTLALRAQAVAELARAERTWRVSKWTSAWPLTWLVRLVFVAWFLAVCVAAMMVDWDTAPCFVAVLLALFQMIGGWVGMAGYDAARRAFPPVPAAEFLRAPAADGTCEGCGAQVAFAADAFATVCTYCGGDSYREALARAARGDADQRAAAAQGSLRAAMVERDARRVNLLLFIAFVTICELFYAVVFAIGWVGSFFDTPY